MDQPQTGAEMIVARLATQSLGNRSLSAALTVLAIALSVTLFLGVDKVRTGARQSFANTISGTDLIVGARTGEIQLLLYSIFRIGNATNNITWKSYSDIAASPDVAWSVPLSLGDSHRGFRVLGTTPAFFEHYKYRRHKPLEFSQGAPFQGLYDVVLGSSVAEELGYALGDKVIIAHGTGRISFIEHGDKPFRVSGILKKTGTPVDRTLHVSLAAIEAIHADWTNGMPAPGQTISADQARNLDLTPKAITAALIGLKSKLATFTMQRRINEYRQEPLSAIIPGATLQQLWGLIGTAETALSVVSAMVIATALLGMVTSILTTLNERRREMAILRSVGATPVTILGLLTIEAALLTLLGIALGLLLFYIGLAAFQPVIDRSYSLQLSVDTLDWDQWVTLGAIFVAGVLAGLIPALRAYRLSVADGMTVKT